MRTALISVYNKTGIVDFARQLKGLEFDIIASRGTAEALKKEGIAATDIAAFTGQGPILEHRVVTLDPKIHAGILARDTQEHRGELEKKGYCWIDLVCVDLYPLEQEIKRPGATEDSVTELTDIGGRALLTAAAKGKRIVICDPTDRQRVIDWLKQGEPDREKFVRALSAKAELICAGYCLTSARYQSCGKYDGFFGSLFAECEYGENPWQRSNGLFSLGTDDPLAVERAELLEGNKPGSNVMVFLDRLLQTITHIAAAFDVNGFAVPNIAAASKHGNPCGAAFGDDPKTVLANTVMGDPKAILGGALIANFPIDGSLADIIRSHGVKKGKRIVDMVVAPDFTQEAIEELARKTGKCRIFKLPALTGLNKDSLDTAPLFRQVRGGFLPQQNYTFVLNLSCAEIQKFGQATVDQEKDLLLAWAVGSTSNSNTITLVRKRMLIGNGVGQQSRVDAAELAVQKARKAYHVTIGSVGYSDSFFPFPDGSQVLADAGVSAILTSSGSINDQKVIEACQRRGVTLYLIPDKVGRGFFAH